MVIISSLGRVLQKKYFIASASIQVRRVVPIDFHRDREEDFPLVNLRCCIYRGSSINMRKKIAIAINGAFACVREQIFYLWLWSQQCLAGDACKDDDDVTATVASRRLSQFARNMQTLPTTHIAPCTITATESPNKLAKRMKHKPAPKSAATLRSRCFKKLGKKAIEHNTMVAMVATCSSTPWIISFVPRNGARAANIGSTTQSIKHKIAANVPAS